MEEEEEEEEESDSHELAELREKIARKEAQLVDLTKTV